MRLYILGRIEDSMVNLTKQTSSLCATQQEGSAGGREKEKQAAVSEEEEKDEYMIKRIKGRWH